MSGIFTVDALVETIKAKETYWVLAVPEVAKCLLENAEALWGIGYVKKATAVVCSGLVGKGALSLDMPPEYSVMLKSALESLGKRLEEFATLRTQKKPQAEWEPLVRLLAVMKALETGEVGARGKGSTSEVVLLGTSDRLLTRNPFGTLTGGGATGAVRWDAAMAGDRRNMAVFLASVKDAVAAHGLRSAAACVAAAMLGPAAVACETARDASWHLTAGEIVVKPGADTLPGALWVATTRGDHLYAVARVRVFNAFWDGVGVERNDASAFDVIGVARPLRLVNEAPAHANGVHVYKIDLGAGIVSDAMLSSLVRAVEGVVKKGAADGDATKAAAITAVSVKLGRGSTLDATLYVSTAGELGVKARGEVKVGNRSFRLAGVSPSPLGGTVWVYMNGIAMDDVGKRLVLEWVALQAMEPPDALTLAKDVEVCDDCEMLGVVAVRCPENVIEAVMRRVVGRAPGVVPRCGLIEISSDDCKHLMVSEQTHAAVGQSPAMLENMCSEAGILIKKRGDMGEVDDEASEELQSRHVASLEVTREIATQMDTSSGGQTTEREGLMAESGRQVGAPPFWCSRRSPCCWVKFSAHSLPGLADEDKPEFEWRCECPPPFSVPEVTGPAVGRDGASGSSAVGSGLSERVASGGGVGMSLVDYGSELGGPPVWCPQTLPCGWYTFRDRSSSQPGSDAAGRLRTEWSCECVPPGDGRAGGPVRFQAGVNLRRGEERRSARDGGVTAESARAGWRRQWRRANEAIDVMSRLADTVRLVEGGELIAKAGADERQLLCLARDEGRNVGWVEQAAQESSKEIKLRCLAGRLPERFGVSTAAGCPEDHCSLATWVAYRVRVRQDSGLGAETAAARKYRRMVKAEGIHEAWTSLRNYLFLLERGMDLAWPGFSDEPSEAEPCEEGAGDAAALTELLRGMVDKSTVAVLRELWLPCDCEDGGLEHLGWLPTGGSGRGGRGGGGGRGLTGLG